MGLDAFVRCRCFEKGCLKPGPVPVADLYIDEGHLYSRTLSEAQERLDHRRFDARYGELEDAFDHWLRQPCEHEYGEYCSEWVANTSGWALFDHLVKEAGGEQAFPVLSHLLPAGNGGLYPAEKALATLKELERFIEVVTHPPFATTFEDVGYLFEGRYPTAERLKRLLVASIETGNPIVWC